MNPGLNSRSFWKIIKLKEIIANIFSQGKIVPFIAIVETWLKPHITDAQIHLENYQIFRADREGPKNGGSLLYILNIIPIDKSVSFDDDTCSCVICLSSVKKCILVSLYRPPNSTSESFKNLLNFADDFLTKYNENNKLSTIIFGDFNFPGVKWESGINFNCPVAPSSFSLLTSFVSKYFLNQHVMENTRKNNTLDLIFTDNPHIIQLIQVDNTELSDHRIIKISTSFFNNSSHNLKFTEEPCQYDFSTLNLKSSNRNGINQEFSSMNWNSLMTGNIDEFPAKFNKTIFDIVSKHTKLKNPTKRKSYVRNLHSKNRKIRKYNKKINLSQNPTLINKFKLKINSLQDEKTKELFIQQLHKENLAIKNIKNNPKYFFNYSKRLRNIPYSPNLLVDGNNIISDPKCIADTLQKQFESVFSLPLKEEDIKLPPVQPEPHYPLSDNLNLTKSDFICAIDEMKASSSSPKYDIPSVIFKTYKEYLWIPMQLFWTYSFDNAQIPQQYKIQTIVPIHKKGSKTNPENFRPIATTPNPIKIFERVLRKKLSNYLELNNYLSENQHGFRSNRSCSTQLIHHTNSVFNSLNQGSEVDTIYVDYSKAFDKVDHSVLLKKLKLFHIGNNYIKWFECFLRGRTQKVVVNNSLSYETAVQSGVPQGSVLGPLMFNININDLPDCLEHCTVLTFADDTKLISDIQSVNDTRYLQANLDRLFLWSKDNNMDLNLNKFDLMQFKPNCNSKSLNLLQNLPFADTYSTYQLPNSTTLESSCFVKDLGIFIDCQLDWSIHIYNVCKKARRISGWVLNTFVTRNRDPMIQLFNSLIRPIIEYNSIIWNPYKIKDINQIEQIQRSFTYRISGMASFNYWDRLTKLNISSLQRRREKSIIIYIWKIKHNTLPNSINLEFKDHLRSQSTKAILPKLPRTNCSLLTKYENSFVIIGCKLWNSLPAPLTRSNNINEFKLLLRKYLSDIPDRPPLPGYSSNNNNSLLNLKPAQ